MASQEEMDYTTAPCECTDRDRDIVAEYLVLKDLDAKDVSQLDAAQKA